MANNILGGGGIGGITPMPDLRFAPMGAQAVDKGSMTDRLDATASALVDAVDNLDRLADQLVGRVVMPPNQMAQGSMKNSLAPDVPSTGLFDVLNNHMNTLVHLRTRMQAAIKRVEERL